MAHPRDSDYAMDGALAPKEEGNDEDERPIKRRKVKKASCRACRRSKTACRKEELADRCEGCIKRNEDCTWDPPVLSSKIPEEVAVELAAVHARLALLEQQLARKQDRPDAPPIIRTVVAPSPDTSASARHHSTPLSPAVPVQPTDTETEDAAQALEDIALGKRQYGAFGLQTDNPLKNLRPVPSTSVIPPGSWTSILLPPEPSPSQRESRASDNVALLSSLPLDEAISAVLVDVFESTVSWNYSILHMPTFHAECRQLWQLVRSGAITHETVDPAWLSGYYTVIAWALSTLLPATHNLPPALHLYSNVELAQLPTLWAAAADECLQRSSWASRPQLRCVQAIFLRISHNRPSSQAVERGEGSDGSSFFVWLSAAIRILQCLGWHLLGSDPEVMPNDDPGLPKVKCLLKREMAKRVWAFAVAHDMMFCLPARMGQITPDSYTTDAPLAVDEADLGLTMEVPSYPSNYLCDYSYSKLLFVVAQYQWLTVELSRHRQSPPGYDTILQLNAGLQSELRHLEQYTDTSNPRLKPYHHALLTTVLHHRVLRLHRSFFMRGINPSAGDDKRYAISVAESRKSANAVANGLDQIAKSTAPNHLWYLPSYGLSGALTLFLSLLQKEEQRLDTSTERQNLLKIRGFYASLPLANTPKSVPHQACFTIDQLLAAPRAGAASSIFRDTATRMMRGDDSVPHPFSSTAASSQPTPAFSDSLFPSLNLNMTLSRAFPSLPASRAHSPDPTATETFDAAASREALNSFSQLEGAPGGGGFSTMQLSTDWGEILRGMDNGGGVLEDGW